MSITKNIIAVSVIQLGDEKKIALDSPITKYLKNLPVGYNQIQLYQLLNHSSGIPDYVHVKGYMEHANNTQNTLGNIKSGL